MSEYNRETGILTLTHDDALDFHRTADRIVGENPPMEFYAKKLQDLGYEVSGVTEDKLDVKAPEDEIFEILSGQSIYL